VPYWARVIGSFGHDVRWIAPQFLKPFLKGQKNDPSDAAAICKAVSRPEMRFVAHMSIEQQYLQALHRIRSRLIGSRTQLGNQIRGLLAEYGVILPLHLSQARMHLPTLFSEPYPLLSAFARALMASMYEELCAMDERVTAAIGGSAIGQTRAEAVQLAADLDRMKTAGDRISKARNAVEATIPSYVQMYKTIESDVQELEPTLRRLKIELALYDGRFPAQHEQTSRSIVSGLSQLDRCYGCDG
jgi:hypothetical protein